MRLQMLEDIISLWFIFKNVSSNVCGYMVCLSLIGKIQVRVFHLCSALLA